MRDILCKLCHPRFEIKLEVLYGKGANIENTLFYLDVCNLAQKLDNSVQIVRIAGHV